MSILSNRQDGWGFHYGFREGDHRQINVREEGQHTSEPHWKGYVGGEMVPNPKGGFGWSSKDQAEAAAIAWAEANPVEE